MSQTPKTDEQVFRYDETGVPIVPAAFARQLEIDLADCQAKLTICQVNHSNTLTAQLASDDACRELRAKLAQSEADAEAIRALMNTYNLGGWTDAIAPMKRALAAEARLRKTEDEYMALMVKQLATPHGQVPSGETKDSPTNWKLCPGCGARVDDGEAHECEWVSRPAAPMLPPEPPIDSPFNACCFKDTCVLLAKDAARYRFLRDSHASPHFGNAETLDHYWYIQARFKEPHLLACFDDTVDSAIAQQEGRG